MITFPPRFFRGLGIVTLLLAASPFSRAADYSWIAPDGRFWTGNTAQRQYAYGTANTPPSSGPVGTDNLLITTVGPVALQNSAGDLAGGMNRAINNLSSNVAGASVASGTPLNNFTSLTVGNDLNLSAAASSLTLQNSSAAPITTGAMTVTVNGNVNIGVNTALYLGVIRDTGTPTSVGNYLNGFTANSTAVGKGQINVAGKLMLQHSTTNVTLGDVNVASTGVVTLNGSGTDKFDGQFNKTIVARSITGAGVIENSIIVSNTNPATSSNATLSLNTLASTTGTFGGTLRNGNGTNAVLNLAVSGSGRQTLTGTSTYTGSTSINGGTLIVGVNGEGALGNTAVSVNNAGTLAGSGSIAGSVTVNSGGVLSPGNSPGTQEYGSLTLNAQGNYNWQIHDATGVAGATNGWDLIEVSGALNLNSLSDTNQFNINLWSLSQVGPDGNGDALNFDPLQSYQWTLITADSISYNGSYAFADLFQINVAATAGAGGFSNAATGTWSVVEGVGGQSVLLSYNAVPEPSVLGLGVVAAVGFLVFRRRRAHKS